MSLRQLVIRIVAIVGVVVLVVFVIYQTIPLLVGPKALEVIPADGATITTPLVTITGQTERARNIFINKTSVILFEDGDFVYPTALTPGINHFDIIIQDKHGRSRHIERTFFHADSAVE